MLCFCCWQCCTCRSFPVTLPRCGKCQGGRGVFLTKQLPLLALKFHFYKLWVRIYYYYALLGSMAGFFPILYIHFHITLPSALCRFSCIKNVIVWNGERLLEIKSIEASEPFHTTAPGADEGGQALWRCFPPTVELLDALPCAAGL